MIEVSTTHLYVDMMGEIAVGLKDTLIATSTMQPILVMGTANHGVPTILRHMV